MEIKIRNVDPVAVKKIDELAKKQGISRQEFLKNQLETLAFFRLENNREVHLQNIIDKNILVMEQFSDSVKRLNDFLDSMTTEDALL
jgi:hypothetical protein